VALLDDDAKQLKEQSYWAGAFALSLDDVNSLIVCVIGEIGG